MNTKNSKKHPNIHYCETKDNNGEPEVFVLPPNLLEKLGIKLDNIVSVETPANCKYSTDFVDKTLLSSNPDVEDYFETTKGLNKKNESSILETASLMKESVFLSPTFVPTVANVIAGEVEIARPYDDSLRCDVIVENGVRESNSFPGHIKPKQNDTFCNNAETSQKIQTNYLKNNLVNDNAPCKAAGTEENCTVFENFNHDYKKENTKSQTLNLASSSEINVENNVIIPNSTCKLVCNYGKKSAIKNKIEVISEEAVDVAKLYRPKSLNPNLNNNVLTPISIDMLLPIAKKKSNTHDLNKVEKTKCSENVVSSLHDIGKSDPDITESETSCNFAVRNVVNNVNLLCSDNEAKNSNIHSNNRNILIDESVSVRRNGELAKLTKINKVIDDNLSDLHNKVDNNYNMDISIAEKIKEMDSHDFSAITNDIDPISENSYEKISIDACNLADIDKIADELINNYELENIGKFDLYFESHLHSELSNSSLKSIGSKRPLDVDMMVVSRTDCEKEELDKEKRMLTDDNKTWTEENTENVSLNEQVYTEKEKILSEVVLCNNNEKEVNTSKTVLRKSKLCIQGVEKPGGDNVENITNARENNYIDREVNNTNVQNNYDVDQTPSVNESPASSQSGENTEEGVKRSNILKTYKREKKTFEGFPPHFNAVKLSSDSYEINENKDSTIDLDVVCKTSEFCLCEDFGQLKYYDYDCSYEHIHFWNHKDVTSDRDLIFSMYNVESFCNTNPMCNYDDLNTASAEVSNKRTEEAVNKICWNEIYDDINYTETIGDETENNENQNVVTETIQPNSPTSQTDFESNDTKLKSEISLNNVDTQNNQLEVDAENNTGYKETSDIIYNTCLKITETNKVDSLAEGELEKDSESVNMGEIQNSNEASKIRVKKRKSNMLKREGSTSTEGPLLKKDVKCGVCDQIMARAEWEHHSSEQHGHIAWKAGETIDFENSDLRRKIRQKLKNDGVLKCGFCDIEANIFKRYMYHVLECYKAKFKSDNKKTRPRRSSLVKESLTNLDPKTTVNCGVCNENVKSSNWIIHICQKHNYLAWISGQTPLNLDDEDSIEKHLCSIVKDHGALICSLCGVDRKYGAKSVKAYLRHVQRCDKLGNVSIKMEKDTIEERLDAQTEQGLTSHVETADAIMVKCGVCELDVSDSDWYDHIGKEHNYLAWKEGEDPLDLKDKEQVWKHLYAITKKRDGLICSKCGRTRKYAKKYLSHIKECDGTSTNVSILTNSINETQDSEINISTNHEKDVVKCGVCMKKVASQDWLKHIGKRHNYMAWKDGESPLKIKKESVVENHLNNLMKEHGRLSCPKCDLDHKYEVDSVNTYLSHVDSCGQTEEVDDQDSPSDVETKMVKCGVCGQDVKASLWITHIENKHNYLAWKDGDTPLTLDDTESIRLYLFTIINKVEAFKCSKCGVQKKYPKSFITHLEGCNAFAIDTIDQDVSSGGMCKCAVCSEEVPVKKWKEHAMNDHYNIAWRVGDVPIDLKSSYGTEKYLKEYKQKKGRLICKICGITRMSPVGFYAHILTCGKTEEELDEYRNLCEVCNNKYLCIYKNQHMAFHREQEYAKESKLRALEQKEKEPQETAPVGRRRAAVKANTVIEKLNSTNEFKYTCGTCGFDTDCEKKMNRHKCVNATFEENSDSDESEDSEDSKDFDLSAEEDIQDISRKKKYKESMVQAKVPNVPFKYNEVNSYTAQSNEDFFKVHFTNETLFPHWLRSECEVLVEQQLDEYLPATEQSCQIKFDDEFITFKRYEAKESIRGHCLFVGASVQCLSWVPPRLDDEDNSRSYLAVSCHRGSDTPRYNFDEIAAHAGLIQIWDFGNFQKEVPNFVMGLAHDYGTIWAMDWCPSGAREIAAADNKCARLGLLAVACSDGYVYILSVPYPSTEETRSAYLKLNPVAILKLSSGPGRRLYQATAVTWTKEKGHTFVVVGYADGTTAMYDLTSTSPLLSGTENGIRFFYPYHDDREHNVTVTDMDSIPAGAGVSGGTVCSASLGGVSALLRPAAPLARLLSHSSATGCRFTPGWPSVLIAVDDSIGSQAPNELEWYGCARRLGPVRTCCGCARCGRVLIHAPPVLRTLRALPPYAELRKQNILGIKAVPLTKKRERVNDELSMQVEPLTYEHVVTQYGIEIFSMDTNDKNNSINTVKEQWTERFPLQDVTSMAFCPSERHHEMVAVALHAGFILVVAAH